MKALTALLVALTATVGAAQTIQSPHNAQRQAGIVTRDGSVIKVTPAYPLQAGMVITGVTQPDPDDDAAFRQWRIITAQTEKVKAEIDLADKFAWPVLFAYAVTLAAFISVLLTWLTGRSTERQQKARLEQELAVWAVRERMNADDNQTNRPHAAKDDFEEQP